MPLTKMKCFHSRLLIFLVLRVKFHYADTAVVESPPHRSYFFLSQQSPVTLVLQLTRASGLGLTSQVIP